MSGAGAAPAARTCQGCCGPHVVVAGAFLAADSPLELGFGHLRAALDAVALGAGVQLGLRAPAGAFVGAELDDAEAALHQAAHGYAEAGNFTGLVWVLPELAAISLLAGDPARAVLVQALADTTARRAGAQLRHHVLGLPDVRTTASDDLGPSQVARTYAAAETWPSSEIIAVAIGDALIWWASAMARAGRRVHGRSEHAKQ